MNEIKLNLENLSDAEREQLMALVGKANKQKSKVWKPEYGDVYHLIGLGCSGDIGKLTWYNDESDIEAYELGNVFRTEEEAKEEITRRKILTKWKRLSIESGENENPWDREHGHYTVYFSKDRVLIQCIVANKMSTTYFASKRSIIHAISEIGENNVKKYILEVNE